MQGRRTKTKTKEIKTNNYMQHDHNKNTEIKEIYICPMHEHVQQDKPGICPECGMRLVLDRSKKKESHKHEGHDKHAGHTPNLFKKRFYISLILTIPIFLYSEIAKKIGIVLRDFIGLEYVVFILGSFVLFYGGFVFIRGSYREIKGRTPGMMTLIALAIIVAYVYSVIVTFTKTGGALWWELTTLITIMLLGHWMEMKSVSSSQSALSELSKLLPDTAEIIERDNKTRNVPLSELKVGSVVLVRPGGKIPSDGVVIEGSSEVNESIITGESKPILKKIGEEVIAGSLNGDGSLKVKITKIGENTFLAGVVRLVKEAQGSKSRLQILSDRAAFYLTIIAIFSGILTIVLWLVAKAEVSFALERLVAVLVIACPHALGLAIPLVATISTTMAAKNGFLIRDRLALEAARNIDVVLFDKTGTLTTGGYGVSKILLNNNSRYKDQKEILQLAAIVDSHSEHFIAKAIVNEAKLQNLSISEVKDFKRIPGKGVSGKIKNSEVFVGGYELLKELKLSVPIEVEQEIKKQENLSNTVIFVVAQDVVVGAILLSDIIREESRDAISGLKEMGINVSMITGDSQDVASFVALDLGIDEYFARVLPEDKSKKVKELQQRGLKVAFVGDGVNDAPALVQADVGIAIGAGTNVAVESAGIILVKNDPRDVVKIIKLSKKTYSKMLQNLFWATGYNTVAIPLAAGALAFRGVLLEPAIGAIFMSASTVIVAINALLLKNIKLE